MIHEWNNYYVDTSRCAMGLYIRATVAIALITLAYFVGWESSVLWHRNSGYVPGLAALPRALPTGYRAIPLPKHVRTSLAVGDRVDVLLASEPLLLDALVLGTKQYVTLMIEVSDYSLVTYASYGKGELTIRKTVATGPPKYGDRLDSLNTGDG